MSDHHAEDVAALRLELGSLRARQEVLAEALAAAGDELEKLTASRESKEVREAIVLADDIEAMERSLDGDGYQWEHLGDASKDIHILIRGLRAVVRGDTDASTSGTATEETA